MPAASAGGVAPVTKHVNLQPHQIGREGRQAFDLALGRAPFHFEILALDVAELAHALCERAVVAVSIVELEVTLREEADAPDFGRGLREGDEWREQRSRRERAGSHRDNQSAVCVHSITLIGLKALVDKGFGDVVSGVTRRLSLQHENPYTCPP